MATIYIDISKVATGTGIISDPYNLTQWNNYAFSNNDVCRVYGETTLTGNIGFTFDTGRTGIITTGWDGTLSDGDAPFHVITGIYMMYTPGPDEGYIENFCMDEMEFSIGYSGEKIYKNAYFYNDTVLTPSRSAPYSEIRVYGSTIDAPSISYFYTIAQNFVHVYEDCIFSGTLSGGISTCTIGFNRCHFSMAESAFIVWKNSTAMTVTYSNCTFGNIFNLPGSSITLANYQSELSFLNSGLARTDTAGNLAEWVADGYEFDAYGNDRLAYGAWYFGNIADLYGITQAMYFTKNQPSKSEELANSIEVPTQSRAPAASAEVFKTRTAFSIAAAESITVECKYSKQPVIATTIGTYTGASAEAWLVDANGAKVTQIQVSAAEYYAWGAVVTAYNNSGSLGNCKIFIDGHLLEIEGEEVYIAEDSNSITENQKQVYKFKENHLVQDIEIAETIAEGLLSSYKDPRKDVVLDWRGDPSFELGDIVEVPEYQKNGIDTRADYMIIKQQLNFDGTLRATLEGRKIPETTTTTTTTTTEEV